MWVLWCHGSDCHHLWWRKFRTTASSIESAIGGDSLAATVAVKFQGGPSKFRTYEGSLAMFTIDRVLRAVECGDAPILWLLRFNPGSSVHIKDQLKSLCPSALSHENKKFHPGGDGGNHYERDDLLSHYEGGERVTDYVQVGDSIIPILESGRQGAAMKMNATDNNDGHVARWSSSGVVNV